MQDPYSAMMSSQQRPDPYKSFPPPNRSAPGASEALSQPGSAPSGTPYYHGLNFATGTYGGHESYQSMASGMGQDYKDYTPMPAHMGSHNPMNSNGLSRVNPTTHTITHTATSPQSSTHIGLSDMHSPGPSTSRVSLSPEGQGHSHSHGHSSSPGSLSLKQESSGSDNSSIKSSNNDEDSQGGIPPKKRSHDSPPGPGESHDETYWDKRKKNNESAKRSRESRRMKEEQIALRVVYLEQENLQLRTEVSLLKSEIEKLRCMLYNS